MVRLGQGLMRSNWDQNYKSGRAGHNPHTPFHGANLEHVVIGINEDNEASVSLGESDENESSLSVNSVQVTSSHIFHKVINKNEDDSKLGRMGKSDNNSDSDSSSTITDYCPPLLLSDDDPLKDHTLNDNILNDTNAFQGLNADFIDISALQRHLHKFHTSESMENEYYEGTKKDQTANETYLKYTFYSEKTGLVKTSSLADVAGDQLAPILCSCVFWLDIYAASKEELKALSEIIRLHQLTVEDFETELEDAREKCDVFEQYYSICIMAFQTDGKNIDYLSPVNLQILAFPGFVVTLHQEPLSFGRTLAKRIRLLSARMGLGTGDWIVYALLEDVIEQFTPAVRDIEVEVDSIDDLTLVLTHNDQADMIHRIASIRKRLTRHIRLLASKVEVLRVITKRCASRFIEDAMIYLRDLQDHVIKMENNLYHYDETINRSHSNYLAQISIEISHTSNKLSDVMKKLTAAASVVLPWSLVSGIFGMNMHVPGASYSYHNGSWVPFATLFTVMSILSAALYVAGRKRDWF